MNQTNKYINLVNPTGKINFHTPKEDGLINILNFDIYMGKENKCVGFCFNYDGSLLITLDHFKNISIFQIKNKRYSVISKGNFDLPILSVKCGKEYLCVVKENKFLDIYSLSESKFIHSLPGHKFKIRALKFNSIKNILLSLSTESICLWDVPSFKIIKTIYAEKSQFTNAIFSEDGLFIIALQNDNKFIVYDVGNYQNIHIQQLEKSHKLSEIATCNESKNIIFGGNLSFFIIYDFQKNEMKELNFQTNNYSMTKMRLTYNNYLIVLHDDGNELSIFDISNDFRLYISYRLPNNLMIKDFAFDFENNNISFLTNLGSIFLYDLKTLIIYQKKKPFHSNPEITFSLSTFTPNINTLTTDQDKLKEMQEMQNNQSNQIYKETMMKNDESSEMFKENISIGYMNQSVKNQKTSTSSSFNEKSDLSKTRNLKPSTKNIDFLKNSLLNTNQLRNYLWFYKQFPEKQRLFIWKNLLQLPENKEAFDNLIARGIAKEYHNLYKKYQLNSENLFRKLQRLSSAFGHYNVAFLKVPFLQDLIFPFVKLFSHNELWCFELILSFFLNWGQHFFECSPNPPINYFKCINEIVKFFDNEFLVYLQNFKITSLFLLWPSFQVLFTDILDKDEWLSLMDYLILNHDKPELLIYFLSAFILFSKQKIMQNDDQILPLCSYEKSWKIDKIIKFVEKMEKTLPENFLEIDFKRNLPVIKDQYPVYNFYPIYDLDEHRKMREKIIEDEEKYLKEKEHLNLDKIKLISNKLLDDQDCLKTDWLNFTKRLDDEKELLNIEHELMMKKQLQSEENINHNKLVKMEQLENNFKRTIKDQIESREQEKSMIEREIAFKKKMEDIRLGAKIKEETLNNLQFQSIMKLNNLVQQRTKEEDDKRNYQKQKFYESQDFYENCIDQEKQNKEKTLFSLRRDLDHKRELVENYVKDEYLSKNNINKDFLLEQMDKELMKTHDNNAWEINHEIEKEKINTNEFLELKKTLEIQEQQVSAQKKKKTFFHETKAFDEGMETMKNDIREEMLSQNKSNKNNFI